MKVKRILAVRLGFSTKATAKEAGENLSVNCDNLSIVHSMTISPFKYTKCAPYIINLSPYDVNIKIILLSDYYKLTRMQCFSRHSTKEL